MEENKLEVEKIEWISDSLEIFTTFIVCGYHCHLQGQFEDEDNDMLVQDLFRLMMEDDEYLPELTDKPDESFFRLLSKKTIVTNITTN